MGIHKDGFWDHEGRQGGIPLHIDKRKRGIGLFHGFRGNLAYHGSAG